MVPAKQLLSGDDADENKDKDDDPDCDKTDKIAIKIMTLINPWFTILRMLTGDEVASDGSASILGHQLDSDRRTFLSQIGYCPQFDSIIPQVIRM